MSRSSAAGSQAVRGVVCRSEGRWLLKALADLTSRKARSDEYRPASGGEDLAPVLGLGRSLSSRKSADSSPTDGAIGSKRLKSGSAMSRKWVRGITGRELRFM